MRIGLLCASAIIASATTAQATNLGIPGFAGYSVFGQPCPLCDSITNFTVYQNTDGNWTDDAYFNSVSHNGLADVGGQWGASVDGSAAYVYMYQPTNKDSTPSLDNPLSVLSISMKSTNTLANITSAGYFGGVFLGEIGQTVDANPHFDVDDIDLVNYVADVAGDFTPSRANEGTVGLTATSTPIFAPSAVHSELLISNPSVDSGMPTQGVLFEYGTAIPTGSSSATVFFTSNQRPGYTWGETESLGGTGATGDVPAPVPVPAGAVLMGSAIAAFGFARRKRKA